MNGCTIKPVRLEVHRYEAPLATPRQNAFGKMTHRPALFVMMEDASGACGWGEVFCNWPVFGASHRARIVSEIMAPLVLGQEFSDPPAMLDAVEASTQAIVVQCDEPGPFDQCASALEIAAWNCIAARREEPLSSVLKFDAAPTPVLTYASGLTAPMLEAAVPPLLKSGWTGFKLKVGFDHDLDVLSVKKIRNMVGSQAEIMIDANQSFTKEQAVKMADALAPFNVTWFEEPIGARRPIEDWQWLSQRCPIALAAGENVRGLDAFRHLIEDGGVRYIQPDIIKWGGIGRAIKIASIAKESSAFFAPHYLGGAVGLYATAELASAHHACWLEVDANRNPLRETSIPNESFCNGYYRPGSLNGGPTAFDNIVQYKCR